MRVCTALCTILAHSTTHNKSDNFLSYPPDNHHCSSDAYLREGGTNSAPGASIVNTVSKLH